MDFSPDEGQQAIVDVVNSVLGRDNSWDALVAGGVTALAVPERLGGDGVAADPRWPRRSPRSAGTAPSARRWPRLDWAWCRCSTGLATSSRTAFWPGVARGGVLTAALNEPGSSWPRVKSGHGPRRGSCRAHQYGVLYAPSASEVGQINEVADIDAVVLAFVHDWLADSTSQTAGRLKASPEPPVAHTTAGTKVSQA